MTATSTSTPLRPPLAPALSVHSIPRTSSNKSLSSLNAVASGGHGTPRSFGGEPSPYGHGDIYATPMAPFTVAPLTPTLNDSPRSDRSPRVLHHSTSNPSLRSAPPLRPSGSIPSLRNVTDPLPSPASRQRSRTHCPSPSAPPSPAPYEVRASTPACSSRPPTVLLVKTMPGSPPAQRSTSEIWSSASPGIRSQSALGGIAQTPSPRLQRKKSSASLLVSGIGRGLGRVGSVIRRSGNSNNTAATTTANSEGPASGGAGPLNRSGDAGKPGPYGTQTWAHRTWRHPSSQLQDLFEDENEGRSGGGIKEEDEDEAPAPKPRSRKSRDALRTRTAATLPQDPSHRQAAASPALGAKEMKYSGVSLPFNVQHELHVSADLDGLPNQWIQQLKSQGLSDSDLLLITAAQKRQRAVKKIALNPIQRPEQPVQPADSSPTGVLLPSRIIARMAEGPSGPSGPSPRPALPDSNTAATQSQSRQNKMKVVGRRLSRFNPSATNLLDPVPVRPAALPVPKPVSPVAAPVVVIPAASPPTLATPTPPRSSSLAAPAAEVLRVRPIVPQRTASSETTVTLGSIGGASGVYRKPSIISKLLDDLDSVSAHPSRPQNLSAEVIQDLGGESAYSSAPASPTTLHGPLSNGPLSINLPETQVRAVPAGDRRLSEELRDFRDLHLSGADDGWASSVLAAWIEENSIAMNRTRTTSPPHPPVLVSQRIPERVGHDVQHPPTAARFGDAATPPSRPQSLRPIRRQATPSPPPSVNPRRRSRSFDFDPALRATLYSPPPPPPNRRKNNPTFHSIHGSESLSAVPILEKRRTSIDSFGNRPNEVESDQSSYSTPSPSDSELDLGTPPLDGEVPSSAQGHMPHITAKACRTIEASLDLSPHHRSFAPADVSQSVAHGSSTEGTEGGSVATADVPKSADTSTFPHPVPPATPATAPTAGHEDHYRSDIDFSLPTSVVSLSHTSHGSPIVETCDDADHNSRYSFDTFAPVVSTLGLCLNLGSEPSPSTVSASHGHSTSHSHSRTHSRTHSHSRSPPYPHSSHPYANYPRAPDRTESNQDSAHLSTLSFVSGNASPTKSFTSDDMRLGNRASTLSRMSSVASSIQSYDIHQATVHRAYTRVLRRVNEVPRVDEGSVSPPDTPPAEDVVSNTSYGSGEEPQGEARRALEEAAWRVAYQREHQAIAD